MGKCHKPPARPLAALVARHDAQSFMTIWPLGGKSSENGSPTNRVGSLLFIHIRNDETECRNAMKPG